MKTDFKPPQGYDVIDHHGITYICQHSKTKHVMVCEHNDQPSMTHQEFKDECDINNIMKRYNYNQLPDIAETVGQFSQIVDYQEMLNATIHAREAFMQLPAQIRQRFNDSPQAIIEFLDDENNRDEAIKLGLVNPKEEPKPDPILTELKSLNENLKASNQKP